LRTTFLVEDIFPSSSMQEALTTKLCLPLLNLLQILGLVPITKIICIIVVYVVQALYALLRMVATLQLHCYTLAWYSFHVVISCTFLWKYYIRRHGISMICLELFLQNVAFPPDVALSWNIIFPTTKCSISHTNVLLSTTID